MENLKVGDKVNLTANQLGDVMNPFYSAREYPIVAIVTSVFEDMNSDIRFNAIEESGSIVHKNIVLG